MQTGLDQHEFLFSMTEIMDEIKRQSEILARPSPKPKSKLHPNILISKQEAWNLYLKQIKEFSE